MTGPRHDISSRLNRWARIIERYVNKGYLFPEERPAADDLAEKLRTLAKAMWS